MNEKEKEILKQLTRDIAELKKEAMKLTSKIGRARSNRDKEITIHEYCEIIYMILELHKNKSMLGAHAQLNRKALTMV